MYGETDEIATEEISDFDIQTEEPTYEEVKRIIQNLKNNKSPGPDKIINELIKKRGVTLWHRLCSLLIKMWRREQIPDEWKDSYTCPIYKKGDRTNCQNYTAITLLNTAYKIFTGIMYNRLAEYAGKQIGDYQMGFRTNRSTTDNIYMIRQIYEKSYEFNIELHILLIDFTQAFDKVNQRKMIQSMKMIKIPGKIINLTAVILEGSRAKVKLGNGCSESFQIESGLQQGDALFPMLFNIVLEAALTNIDKRDDISTKSRQTCAYADDVSISARTRGALAETFTILKRDAEKYGLIINQEKTKYMRKTRKVITQQDLLIDNMEFEHASSFKYLGSIVNQINTIDEEIQNRIATGNRAYHANKKLLTNKLLSKNPKMKLHKTIIRPVETYGNETWVINLIHEEKLKIFERKILPSIYGPVQDLNNEWGVRTNQEIETLIKGENIA